MAKFPQIIHVVEESGDRDEKWLSVHTDGVSSLTEPNQPVAIYQLVRVGKVSIKKAFVQKGRS